MSKPIKKWECSACGDHHSDKADAMDCCRPDVEPVWVCGECDIAHDDEDQAADCCASGATCPRCMREHAETSRQAAQIRVAGHCDHCNPLFPIEQEYAIDREHQAAQDTSASLPRQVRAMLIETGSAHA